MHQNILKLERMITTLTELPKNHFSGEQTLDKIGKLPLFHLLAYATHPNPVVRYNIVWLLGKSRKRRAFNTIVASTYDLNPEVRYDALLSLGELGDVRAIRFLICRLLEEKMDDGEKGAIANALIKFGKRARRQVILLTQNDRPDIRLIGTNLMRKFKDDRVLYQLSNLLHDSDASVRLVALECLGMIGTKKSLLYLLPFSKCSEKVMEEHAIYWIKEYNIKHKSTLLSAQQWQLQLQPQPLLP